MNDSGNPKGEACEARAARSLVCGSDDDTMRKMTRRRTKPRHGVSLFSDVQIARAEGRRRVEFEKSKSEKSKKEGTHAGK
jgi:hypothetical protein